MKIYFFDQNALYFKKNIIAGAYPAHLLYGLVELENMGLIKIVDNLRNIPFFSKVIVNNPSNVLAVKFLRFSKVFLINLTSMHILSRNKNCFRKFLIKSLFSLFSGVICLCEIQSNSMRELGVCNFRVIELGVDIDSLINFAKNRLTKKNYFLSAGGDAGRNFNFVAEAIYGLKNMNLVVISIGQKDRFLSKKYSGSRIEFISELPYKKYIQFLSSCNAVVLNITDMYNSSDCSGSITCLEAMILGKKIFINKLGWVEYLLPKNSYYIYSSEADLKKQLIAFCKKKNKGAVTRQLIKKYSITLFVENLLKYINEN